jgi:hypothetical protein
MTQLVIWIAACAAIAFLTRDRPMIAVGLTATLWFLVPAIGGTVVTGQATGALSSHPASWLVLTTFAMQCIYSGKKLAQVLARNILLYLVLVVVLAVAYVNTRYGTYGGGSVLLIDQILVPTLMFVLIQVAATRRSLLRLRTLFIVLAAAVVIVAIVQWSVKDTVFYTSEFAQQYWYNPKFDRWMGTLDQPLALSLVVCTVTPLLAAVKHWYLRIPLLALMVVGALVSQSRLGIALVLLGAIYVTITTATTAVQRLGGIAVIGGGVTALAFSPLAAGLLGRLDNDTGSTRARELALDFFATNWSDYLLIGRGISSSYRVGSAAGLGTSLESSILMYSIDIGILFALLYFGCMAYLLVRYRGSTLIRGAWLAGLMVVVIPMTYSALATRSVAGILVWGILALITGASQLRDTEPVFDAESAVDAADPVEVGLGVQLGDHAIVTRS